MEGVCREEQVCFEGIFVFEEHLFGEMVEDVHGVFRKRVDSANDDDGGGWCVGSDGGWVRWLYIGVCDVCSLRLGNCVTDKMVEEPIGGAAWKGGLPLDGTVEELI